MKWLNTDKLLHFNFKDFPKKNGKPMRLETPGSQAFVSISSFKVFSFDKAILGGIKGSSSGPFRSLVPIGPRKHQHLPTESTEPLNCSSLLDPPRSAGHCLLVASPRSLNSWPSAISRVSLVRNKTADTNSCFLGGIAKAENPLQSWLRERNENHRAVIFHLRNLRWESARMYSCKALTGQRATLCVSRGTMMNC